MTTIVVGADADITVHPQARSRSVLTDEDTGRPYAAIVPDLLLARGAGAGAWRRVVDVKYERYDRRGLDPIDIYQGFLYVTTPAQAGIHPDPPTTILLHAGTPGPGTWLVVHGHGQTLARVRSLALNIPDILAALASDPVPRIAMLRQIYTDLTR